MGLLRAEMCGVSSLEPMSMEADMSLGMALDVPVADGYECKMLKGQSPMACEHFRGESTCARCGCSA